MKTALLLCDEVAEPFVKLHGTYPEMYQKYFRDFDLNSFEVFNGNFPLVKDFDLFIATGSKISVYEDLESIKDLIGFTKDAYHTGKKFIGICYGHQLLGHALGGKVEKADCGYLIGIHEFNIIQKQDWLSPVKDSYNIVMLCQDQIMQLPPDAKVHAQSIECPVGMISLDNRFLGIQGHPEFTKEYSQAVFESRESIIGKEKIQKAIESFHKNSDSEQIYQSIKLFLKQ